jgi:hypothetical protein
LTVRLACAAASLLRPTSRNASEAAAAAVTATPAIALPLPIVLGMPNQVIDPQCLYHANMVNEGLNGGSQAEIFTLPGFAATAFSGSQLPLSAHSNRCAAAELAFAF